MGRQRAPSCVAVILLSLVSCGKDRGSPANGSPASGGATPSATGPTLAVTPYLDPGDVRFYMPFKAEHRGFDFSTRRDTTIRAPSDGRFEKKLYYHPTSLRWQVNAAIYSGDAAIDCLFEPGEDVSEQQGRQQLAMLIPDGPVKAGDVLGQLHFVPGSQMALLHLGVRVSTAGGDAQCPLLHATPEVRDSLIALFRRDLPGQRICFDQSY
jgi:hypothetical protein